MGSRVFEDWVDPSLIIKRGKKTQLQAVLQVTSYRADFNVFKNPKYCIPIKIQRTGHTIQSFPHFLPGWQSP